MLNDQAFAQMNRLRTELEKVFGAEMKDFCSTQFSPRVNIWEDDSCFYLEAEMPGVSISDLDIHVLEGDQVSIKGSRTHEKKDAASWITRERPSGNFARTFQLACGVDVDNVKARMKDGILELTLPKASVNQPRKIVVETGV